MLLWLAEESSYITVNTLSYLALPVNDTLALQVVQSWSQLTYVQPDAFLGERHVLGDVISEIAPQKEIGHHKQILFIYKIGQVIQERYNKTQYIRADMSSS